MEQEKPNQVAPDPSSTPPPPLAAKSKWTGRMLSFPVQIWQIIDTKKTDSWLAAVLGVLLRSSAIILLFFALLIIWRMLGQRGFVLQAFSVPKIMETTGIQGGIVAIRLQDAISALKREAASVKKDDLEVGNSDENAAMDIHVMGVEVSPSSIAYQLRYILGRPQKRISGEFIHSGERMSLMLRMTGYPNVRMERPCLPGQEEQAVQELLNMAAEHLLERTDPYRLAVVHYRRKNYAEATKLIRSIIQTRPDERVWAYHAWGNMLREQGRYQEAEHKFQRATTLDPQFALSYQNWGYLLLHLKRRTEAIEKMEKSLQIDPTNPDMWATLGWQYIELGDHTKAEGCYAKSVRYAMGTEFESIAWQSWISAKMNQDSMQAAMKLAQKALETASETSDGYVTRGLVMLLKGDTTQAFEAGMRALELNPNNGIALKMVSRGLFMMGQYEQVIAVTQGIDLPPWQTILEADILNLAAMSYNNIGNHDSAFAVIKRTIAIDTLYALPYSTLAETFAYRGAKQTFFETLEKAFTLGFRYEIIDWTEQPYVRYQNDPKVPVLAEKYGIKERWRSVPVPTKALKPEHQ